ncbi:MBL fold metallo-hydrolase [Sulfobacillus thermosulfidooxidans]|uniref:MBL fold metallo-hydrolase n=1 Tax=Sulfobacillus thermosulfidooxidans TaxID=28034 RepID=UPI00096BC738|nr:MBL fold metallo-hydrolase [Sulfobacillus thermosulfidooxidans]OLZ08748.1 hypothetical protein BFX05_15145 [Sulfobacillus thermosulfidooxidans]OLZ14832.1 hypothetical protein BFX06_05890 [Sulfobacillus thermosulfidooxidans]OLZ22024.1 hypothetical protein BFX07_10480 [Sulfobacillus thermosulfidooxidans]
MKDSSVEVTQITDSVFGIALWDPSWHSYNNCYLINRDGKLLLLDCGKEDQGNLLIKALTQLHVESDSIDVFIATHGHSDHIGASHLFQKAEKWIHRDDCDRLSHEQIEVFNTFNSNIGELYGLSYLLLGYHTQGSIALYDTTTHCLFCGDYICFFGDKLPHNGLLTFGQDLRDKTRAFMVSWSQNSTDRHKYQFETFVQGIKLLSSYKDAMFLATGHGPILHKQIADFLDELVSIDG